jgi:hypothetical protein
LYEQYLNWLQKPKIYVKIRVMPIIMHGDFK